MTTKPAPTKQKSPPHDKIPAPALAPCGSPIAKKLAKHALHTRVTLKYPRRTVQVGPPKRTLPTHVSLLPLVLPPRQSLRTTRPHLGQAASHRMQPVPRAGSPTYWAPRLVAPPTGCKSWLHRESLPSGDIRVSEGTRVQARSNYSLSSLDQEIASWSPKEPANWSPRFINDDSLPFRHTLNRGTLCCPQGQDGIPYPQFSTTTGCGFIPSPTKIPEAGDPSFGTHPQGQKKPHAYPTTEVRYHHPRGFLGKGFEHPSDLFGYPISDETSPRDGPPSPRAGTPARRGPPHYGGHISTGHLRNPTRDSFTPEPLYLLGHFLALTPHNPDGIRPGDRFSRSRGHCPIGKCNTSPKTGEVSRSRILRGLNSGCNEGAETPEKGCLYPRGQCTLPLPGLIFFRPDCRYIDKHHTSSPPLRQ